MRTSGFLACDARSVVSIFVRRRKPSHTHTLAREEAMAIAKAAKAGSAKVSKRAKKVLSGSVAGISAGAVRRMCRRAGVKRVSAQLLPEVRAILRHFVEDTVRSACALAEHARRSVLSCSDIAMALKSRGRTIYGYA